MDSAGTKAEALGEIRAEQAVEALIIALHDPNWEVRGSARKSLQAITGQDFGEEVKGWRKWWQEQQR